MTNRRLVSLLIVTAVAAAVIAVGVTALLVNVFQRKSEAKNPFYRVVELDDDTVESLSARILVEEHRLLPAVVAAIAAGRLRRVGRSARIGGLVADPADSLPSPVCASYPEPR